MSTTAANTLIGACTLSIGNYVTQAGTGTGTNALVDVGHTNGPVTFAPEFSNAEINSERAMGPVKVVPTGMKIKVKVPMLEVTAGWLRVALRQSSGQLTTGTATATLLINDPVEQYHQVTLAGPGPVGGLARVVSFWKCMVESVSEVAMAKGAPSVLDIVLSVLKDDTVTGTTNGSYGKVVDA